jgi:hypothetical protein
MVIRSELLFVESMLTAKACGKGFLQKLEASNLTHCVRVAKLDTGLNFPLQQHHLFAGWIAQWHSLRLSQKLQPTQPAGKAENY